MSKDEFDIIVRVMGLLRRGKISTMTPINPEYKKRKRVGCVVCPKADFLSNGIALLENPKLIDAFIIARGKGKLKTGWIITSENKDYSSDKCLYICRWLNHSFMPFSKKQESLYL